MAQPLDRAMPLPAGLPPAGTARPLSERVLRGIARALVAVVWISATLFGLYILAFYAAAVVQERLPQWNKVLPGLHDPQQPLATLGVGLHFAAGGLILVLGCVQLLAPVRQRWPAVHRWLGRVYIGACIVAALGGLVFIAVKGTIGGPVMNVGFGLYGVLMAGAAVQALRHARAGRIALHRAWALRLFALAIGSWLYRMEYGFWMLFTGGWGHAKGFTGPFDQVMAFFFYLPNLLVVEAFIRARAMPTTPALQWAAAAVLLGATAFLVLGSGYFAVYYWVPPILALVLG